MNGTKVNPALVKDLFEGKRDARQLIQKHKVNVNTVDEHKRVFLNGSGG